MGDSRRRCPTALVLSTTFADHDGNSTNETAFRTYLGLNLQASAQSPDGRTPRRGARHIQAFMRALECETNICPEQARSLAAALGMATGAEAMIALFDVASLSVEEARALVTEIAHALCNRMLP